MYPSVTTPRRCNAASYCLVFIACLPLAALSAEPRQVRDIWPGSLGSDPNGLAAVGNTLFAGAEDGLTGEELWISRGNEGDTIRVQDIRPGAAGSAPFRITNFNGVAVFTALDHRGYELWRSNGTPGGTVFIKDILPGSSGGFDDPSQVRFVTLGNQFLFAADDGPSGVELWRSDGTTAGTVRVRDIAPGAEDSFPEGLFAHGNRVYFAADDGALGWELWRSNGTFNGTQLVKDIRPGGSGAFDDFFAEFASLGDDVLFRANDGSNGEELWKSDGTAGGTLLVTNIRSGFSGSSPEDLFTFGNHVYFAADDGVHGRELWRSDGTPEGTHLVRDIIPGPQGGLPDGTEFGIAYGRLYFRADDGVHGYELWTTDGTETGTYLVSDVTPGIDGSLPRDMETSNEVLFFRASSPHGNELYKTLGTPATTVLVADIYPGPICSSPTEMVDVRGILFFRADDGTFGNEIWRTRSLVLPIDLDELPDMSGNNWPETVTLVRTHPNGTGNNIIHIKDGASGSLVRRIQVLTPQWLSLDLVSLPGQRLGVLSANESSGHILVSHIDATTGDVIQQVPYHSPEWRAVAAEPGSLNGDAVVHVLAQHRSGTIGVQTRRANGSAVRTSTFLGSTWHPVAFAEVPDVGNDGSPDIAVLGRRDGARPTIIIKNVASGSLVFKINMLGPDWVPLDLAVLERPGVGPELAVLFRQESAGRIIVRVVDAATGETRSNVRFFNPDWTPVNLQVVGDSNGDGQQELAVLAVSPAGQIAAQLREVDGGTLLRHRSWVSDEWAPVAMRAMSNAGGGPTPDLAILALRKDDGRALTQRRDAASGSLVRTASIP